MPTFIDAYSPGDGFHYGARRVWWERSSEGTQGFATAVLGEGARKCRWLRLLLAGDFNLRQGEDQVLLDEGWRDSACQFVDVERSDDWTWARGEFRARYDRVYTHAGVAKLAKVPHTHLKVIATPKECQEAKKQRPEAPRSSAQKRPGNIWW